MRLVVFAVLLAASCAAATPVVAVPTAGTTPHEQAPTSADVGASGTGDSKAQLDAATREALALQDTIDRAEEDASALEQRIAVANVSILEQDGQVARAREELQQAERRFQDRIVRMYKAGVGSPFLVLVSASSFADLWSALVLLSRVLDEDNAAYQSAQAASAEASRQEVQLEDQKAQLVEMRALHDTRLTELRVALARQRRVVATLSAKAKQVVARRQASTKLSRAQWRASSIPIGTKIPFSTAVVQPYRDRSYVVAAYQPRTYRTTGERFTAVCSWYGNAFNGRPSASGQIYNMDDLTCASRTLPFGTRIALTKGSKRIVVVVNDRGPYVAGRDLDLSYAAARALDFWGVVKVDAEFVEPATNAAR